MGFFRIKNDRVINISVITNGKNTRAVLQPEAVTIAFLATIIDEKGWSLKRWHGKESTSVTEGNLTGVVIGRNVFESFAREVIFTCFVVQYTTGVYGKVLGFGWVFSIDIDRDLKELTLLAINDAVLIEGKVSHIEAFTVGVSGEI